MTAFDLQPFHWPGTVYGSLLNQRAALAALGDAVHRPPYKAPPQAPVLYIKPRNTLARDGDDVIVLAEAPELAIGATLGLVIGRVACRIDAADALDHLAGYVVVNDISVPHASLYRPSLRFNARDGFCPIGALRPRAEVGDPDALAIRIFVDGVPVHQASTAERVRPAAQLLADVSEFMTLHPGDVLMLGVGAGAPRVRAGQRVAIEIDGVGRLENRFVAEVGGAA